MKVIADLCVVPIGVGVSVSKYVAACERVLNEAAWKLTSTLTALISKASGAPSLPRSNAATKSSTRWEPPESPPASDLAPAPTATRPWKRRSAAPKKKSDCHALAHRTHYNPTPTTQGPRGSQGPLRAVSAPRPSRKTQDARSRILHAESATQNASQTPACQLTRSAIQDRNGLTRPGSPLPVASHHGPHVNSTPKSHLPRVRLQGHSQKGEATQSPSNAPNLPVRARLPSP